MMCQDGWRPQCSTVPCNPAMQNGFKVLAGLVLTSAMAYS